VNSLIGQFEVEIETLWADKPQTTNKKLATADCHIASLFAMTITDNSQLITDIFRLKISLNLRNQLFLQTCGF